MVWLSSIPTEAYACLEALIAPFCLEEPQLVTDLVDHAVLLMHGGTAFDISDNAGNIARLDGEQLFGRLARFLSSRAAFMWMDPADRDAAAYSCFAVPGHSLNHTKPT